MNTTSDMADAVPASIDAIVHATPEDMAEFDPSPSPLPTEIGGLPSKLKGRKRLLHSLQRMSSSPSLARMRSSSNSSSYQKDKKASVSCISLASSGSPYSLTQSTSYGSEFSPQYSTAPTSASSTPQPGTPTGSYFRRPRARTVGRDTPTSIGLPSELRPQSAMGNCISADDEDYFSLPMHTSRPKQPKFKRRENFNFWQDMPSEIRMEILSYLQPKEVVRCSRISKLWYEMCFDGQLWRDLDTSAYYRDIPGDALVNIISSAGPFVRDLNLRGCVQLRERWGTKGKLNPESMIDAVRNLENFSLEGCQIDRSSIHCFLLQNHRLVHINLSGLPGATNHAMKIIAQYCPKVEHLNVTWCCNVNARGLRRVVEGCPNLKDLRAGEVQGWDDEEFMYELFKRNTLERLLLPNCITLTDESLGVLLEGVEPEYDFLTGRVIAPSRKLRHLDLTHCRGLTEEGIRKIAHNCPDLEGLQLSKCPGVTDTALTEILPTTPILTHLDIEELGHNVSNTSLLALAASDCSRTLQHLSISYCEDLSDAGMLPVLRSCTKLSSLDMDNTKISDLVLTECAALVRARGKLAGSGLNHNERPNIGLRLVAYDCAHVTWTGVREILSRNAEATLVPRPSPGPPAYTYPREVIQLKCFYNWQPTVEEHTKRVMRGDFQAAGRLERKWAEWMVASEEANASGGSARRRRRRAREAQMMHADEEEGGMAGTGIGRRRRARSGPGGCVVM